MARLLDQIRSIGIDVSKRQLVRLLIDGQDLFRDEARDVLRAGLETARWVTVDDTGARHKSRNGYCTQIGNDDFTWFGTTGSKSRLNFLDCLRAGHTDYAVNDAALAYMRERSLSCSATALLANHPVRQFADEDAWMAHLQALGLADLNVLPDPVAHRHRGSALGLHHGARLPVRGRGGERRRRAVRRRPPCPVLGSRGAPRSQARRLHRGDGAGSRASSAA